MGTTALQDATYFDNLAIRFPTKPTIIGNGGIDYAGNLWPPLKLIVTPVALPNGVVPAPYERVNPGASFKRQDAKTALEQAKAMITPALLAAKGAVAGNNDEAAVLMEKWFGPRPVGPLIGNQRDWWLGVVVILGVLESFLSSSVHLYYRGAEVQGKADDYPGANRNLTAHDVSGYAETLPDTSTGIIGLCKLFFAKQNHTGQARVKLRGYDSVGGTIIHELSHNLCGTDDHELPNGQTAYGTAGCQTLKTTRQRRAWYNADNIEYFCEETLYGVEVVAPVVTGSVTSVSNLKALFGG